MLLYYVKKINVPFYNLCVCMHNSVSVCVCLYNRCCSKTYLVNRYTCPHIEVVVAHVPATIQVSKLDRIWWA